VSVHGTQWLHFEPLQLLNFDFLCDSSDADPDPASQMDADPDPQLCRDRELQTKEENKKQLYTSLLSTIEPFLTAIGPPSSFLAFSI
jgi:hypothetical protein